MGRILRAAFFVLATLAAGAVAQSASAQSVAPSASGSALPAKPAGQGIAVLAVGATREAREEAFALARAIYGSRLRPTSLDEVRARVLAGDPPPPNGSRELRELAEVRAAVTGEDAATRRLLAGIAQQVGAEALLVVKVERSVAPAPPLPAPPPPAATDDAGAAAADAGAIAPSPGNAAPTTTVVASLFHADRGEFDAARYSPEAGLTGAPAWKSTITSLEGRFPQANRVVGPDAATRPAVTSLRREEGEEKSRPFYASGWFWGAIAGAALIGGIFYLATRDTTDDPIHLQMRVPR